MLQCQHCICVHHLSYKHKQPEKIPTRFSERLVRLLFEFAHVTLNNGDARHMASNAITQCQIRFRQSRVASTMLHTVRSTHYIVMERSVNKITHYDSRVFDCIHIQWYATVYSIIEHCQHSVSKALDASSNHLLLDTTSWTRSLRSHNPHQRKYVYMFNAINFIAHCRANVCCMRKCANWKPPKVRRLNMKLTKRFCGKSYFGVGELHLMVML